MEIQVFFSLTRIITNSHELFRTQQESLLCSRVTCSDEASPSTQQSLLCSLLPANGSRIQAPACVEAIIMRHSKTYTTGTVPSVFTLSLFLFLLNCEFYFLYSALIDISEDEVVVQRFALFHRSLDVFHLALGKYVLEEEGRMIARHKAYLIGKR